MFFPYRAKIELHRVPVLTILVCLLCIGIFAAQSSNRRALQEAAIEHCEHEHSRGFLQALRRVAGSDDPRTCTMLMLTLANSRDEKAELAQIVQRLGSAERLGDQRLAAYYEQALLDSYRSFRAGAPANLTARLAYSPDSWNPLRMLSAAMAHASWSHVIGNLIFFYAFAATIEILLGPLLYLAVLVVLALGTHTVYSIAMMHDAQALPTVGLSGVVMGMIALFVYFIPQARISCFLWLIFFYRRFALPAWLLATWYIGWDVYTMFTTEGKTGVNLVAHLSGAALGFGIGAVFFRQKRHWAQDLVEERG
ncbi:MAG TPA: rhomboid family intramembrane serine protease [Burkholderiales bacterium]|nr:rhomboid family intramembrane serine protease [Burkholderiales bacterium]